MSLTDRWYRLDLNPEPWSIGTVGVGRRSGGYYGYISPNSQLQAYQEAVKESLHGVQSMPPGEYELEFFFWRQLAQYESLTSGKKIRKHQVDATNMQKALEDALQGVLIENDRFVRKISSVIMEQSGSVQDPHIFIHIRLWNPSPFIVPEIENIIQSPENILWSSSEEDLI